jgi:hypothetical protein
MTKSAWIIGFGFVTAGLPTLADDAVTLKYRYSPGQVLLYDGKQSLTVESTVAGATQKFASETVSTREWRVLGVDGKGNARLAMTIVRAKVDATGADGRKIAFDSEKDGENNPLASIVGKPLVEVTLSPAGQVLEIGESKVAGAGQFVAHIRTLLYVLPATAVAPGATWQYDLQLPLPPPLGKGEQVRLRQAFQLDKVAESVATINLASGLAEEIKDKARVAAIAQFLPSGKIELDLSRGVVRSVDLTIDQEVTEFAGIDSMMHVTGSYREVLRDDVAASPGRK